MAKITSFSDAHPPVCLPFRPAGVVVPERVPRIEYLAIRALGEVPRLLLEVTNTPYDSILHFGDKTLWKSRAEFTQLPIYSDASLGDFYLAQSGAIVRHIARTTGTDGDTPMRKALADMAYEASKDIYDAKVCIAAMSRRPCMSNICTTFVECVPSRTQGGIYPESTDAQKTKLKGYLEGVERMLSRGGPYTGGAGTWRGSALTNAWRVLSLILVLAPRCAAGAPLTFGDVGLFHA